jgi:hypothetical protein
MPLTARIREAGARLSAGFLAVLAAAMLAFTWQSFVTQTHIDIVSMPAAATAQIAPAHVSQIPAAPDRPIDCPICHDAALAGHYLTPGPAWVLAPIIAVLWRFTADAKAEGRRARSHDWRSRAPPTARI